MNKRQREWQRQVDEAIKGYEFRMDTEYDYYGKVSKRKKVWKTPKGTGSKVFEWILRIILFLACVYFSLRNIL